MCGVCGVAAVKLSITIRRSGVKDRQKSAEVMVATHGTHVGQKLAKGALNTKKTWQPLPAAAL